MKVSVIAADKTIVIDGAALTFDFPVWPPNLHAIQWNGKNGTKEYTTGPQVWFDNVSEVQPYIDAYNAEAERIAAEGGGA